MRTTFRRLVLLFCALRYGARLLWAAAPHDNKLRWLMHLATRLHARPGARDALHRALPQLGPLIQAFAGQSLTPPETCARSVHDGPGNLGRGEAGLVRPLAPDGSSSAVTSAGPNAPVPSKFLPMVHCGVRN